MPSININLKLFRQINHKHFVMAEGSTEIEYGANGKPLRSDICGNLPDITKIMHHPISIWTGAARTISAYYGSVGMLEIISSLAEHLPVCDSDEHPQYAIGFGVKRVSDQDTSRFKLESNISTKQQMVIILEGIRQKPVIIKMLDHNKQFASNIRIPPQLLLTNYAHNDLASVTAQQDPSQSPQIAIASTKSKNSPRP